MSVQIVDLFCGVGGLTRGLLDAGLDVIAGFDLDDTCKYTYETNNNVVFYTKNIRDITKEDINHCYANGVTKVLVGCAPCQPFSQMRFKMGKRNSKDEKYDLLSEFGRLVEQVQPTIVSMENVPSIRDTTVFLNFFKLLKKNGYYTDGGQVVYCPDYGIPQNRRRFVLLASKLGEIHLIPPTHKREDPTVEKFIGYLPPVKAGEECSFDKLHRAAKLSDINLKRIQHSTPGGTWKDWPTSLQCECHKKKSGQTYTSVYGRMRWDTIGPTITTQLYCYGTGRYGHPEQDRALTLREGALLQTFPKDYDFINPNAPVKIKDIARHIGNAVPPRLGKVIGQSIDRHLVKKEQRMVDKNDQ